MENSNRKYTERLEIDNSYPNFLLLNFLGSSGDEKCSNFLLMEDAYARSQNYVELTIII